MIEEGVIVGFAAAAVRVATPLALAALGETVSERGGVLNLGIEGSMLAGALAASMAGVMGGPWIGVLAGALAGLVIAAVMAAVAVVGRGDQVITGAAVTLGATGMTGLVAQRFYGPRFPEMVLPTLPALPIPAWERIPFVGQVFFNQSPLTYLTIVLVPILWWLLYRTRFGLELRAAGEEPTGARAHGVAVTRVRALGTLIGGGLAGLGGAALVLSQVGMFTERMTAGRGFIAIAIVVLGRWHPVGAVLAALLFGAATALQYLFQAAGFTAVPYQLLLALPYLLALAVLATAVGRAKAPAGLARNP
jgi:simple sugar transport system permease protein